MEVSPALSRRSIPSFGNGSAGVGPPVRRRLGGLTTATIAVQGLTVCAVLDMQSSQAIMKTTKNQIQILMKDERMKG
jgi:hypothetical protein